MTTTHSDVVQVSGLRTAFGTQVIHDDLAFSVHAGEVMGIVGGSGTGKSVLLRTMIGLARPAAGRVDVLGQNVPALRGKSLRRLQQRFGVLFQDGALFSSMTVAQNIMTALKEHTKLPEQLRREIVDVKINMVGLPLDSANKFPSELSGGMRKRAGLARALALDPEVVFLDEPTAGLDPIGAAAFDNLVRSLQQALHLSVIMVTHDLDSLKAVCDRIAVLLDKRVRVGTLDTLVHDDHPWIKEYFRGSRGRIAFATRIHGQTESNR